MIGLIPLMMLSACNPPTIKKPVRMYAISTKLNAAAKGKKYLNFKMKKRYVGEWTKKPVAIGLNEAPENFMCFSMGTWLTVIKPKLKEGSDYYHDKKSKKSKSKKSDSL